MTGHAADDDLPGMWAQADLSGGEADVASSAPATASEGATECDGHTDGPRHPDCPWLHPHEPHALTPATGVTSSDGDRGLSEEVEAIVRAYGDPVTSAGRESLRDTVRALVDLLAARTAQPEGVERVEWGVRWATDQILAVPDERFAWNAVGSRHPENVVRRIVTEYAPVVGPWEVVGDE